MTTASNRPAILWFRNDLRLADHAALHAAIETGRPVLPVFVLDDAAPRPWRLGGASRWWLHHSLEALGKALIGLGAPLVLRAGGTAWRSSPISSANPVRRTFLPVGWPNPGHAGWIRRWRKHWAIEAPACNGCGPPRCSIRIRSAP